MITLPTRSHMPLKKGDLITFTRDYGRVYMPLGQRICTLPEDPEPADFEGGYSIFGVSVNHFRIAKPKDIVLALEELHGQIRERQEMMRELLRQLDVVL